MGRTSRPSLGHRSLAREPLYLRRKGGNRQVRGRIWPRAVFGLTLISGVLVGCANRQPIEIRYLEPAAGPATTAEVLVRQPSPYIWQQLLDRLQQSSFEVTRADGPAGLIVATYHGDPEPYVDCGLILAFGPDDVSKTSGAVRESSFDLSRNGQAATFKRTLDLDTRMVVQVRPADEDTVVSVDATYVLTKIGELDRRSRSAPNSSLEVMSFTTGKRGKFSKGTVCQPSGQLEALVLDILPQAAQAPPTPILPARSRTAEPDCRSTEQVSCQVVEPQALNAAGSHDLPRTSAAR